MYIKRAIEDTLIKLGKQFPCITIYGARQVGKTTLIAHLFHDSFTRISMDDLELVLRAKTNPKVFLESFSYPLIIDEIQKVPELLNEIKMIIDAHKEKWLFNNEPTQLLFILTGSNQTDLKKQVGDSLAGRTAILNIASLSFAEISGYDSFEAFNPDIQVLFKKEEKLKNIKRTRKSIFEDIFNGGMPEYITQRSNRNAFFSSYVQTYLLKDIADKIKASNIPTFLKMMQYLSLRTGCQIDYNDIASNVGVDARTIKEWINLLITSKIIFLLEPYSTNLSNRLIKTPKLYFMDTGLCAYLGRWPNAETLENGPLNGQFYETYVISEIIKSLYNQGYDPSLISEKQIYYYKDRNQKEIDFIIETIDGLYPIEIKKGINPSSPTKNFDVLKNLKKKVLCGLVINSGDKIYKINDNVYEIPIKLIGY